jgi:hypothetical protein
VQTPCGSDLLATTGRHWPVVFAACPFKVLVHAEQPVQAVLQQTPSAITPEVHSSGRVAVWPLGFVVAQVPVEVLQ